MAEKHLNTLRNFRTEYDNRFDDFLEYAARFLLLVGEDTQGSKRYNEVINFISANFPPFAAAEVAEFKKVDGPEDDVVVAEAKLADSELRQVVDKVVDLLKKELNVTTLDDDVIKQIADTIAPEKISQRQVGAENESDKKIQAIVSQLSAQGEKYIDNLEGKFLNYVVAKAKALGPENLVRANVSLTDDGKKAFVSLKGGNLTPDAVQAFLANGANFNTSEAEELANRLDVDVANTYREYIESTPLKESVYNFNITEARKSGLLTEGFAGMFGAWIKIILKSIFGDVDLPIGVSGSKSEVEAFARAIQGEKRYIDSIQKYGLSNRQTYQSRAKLASSIRSFEKETGLKWPFK